MTNSKKNSKSIIALIVMSFLLVASIVLAATGAWFTSQAKQDAGSLTFGTVVIGLDSTAAADVIATSETPNATELLMPGDTLEITFQVNYTGTANAYVVAYVEVTTSGGTGNMDAIEAMGGWYAIADATTNLASTDKLSTTTTSNVEAADDGEEAGLVTVGTNNSRSISVRIQEEIP